MQGPGGMAAMHAATRADPDRRRSFRLGLDEGAERHDLEPARADLIERETKRTLNVREGAGISFLEERRKWLEELANQSTPKRINPRWKLESPKLGQRFGAGYSSSRNRPNAN